MASTISTSILLLALTMSNFTNAAPPKKNAKKEVSAPKEFVLNPSQSTAQILKQLKSTREKARISVVLHSGKEYSGRLGDIGQSAFTLMAIDGKDFFDVVINFNHVEAIEIQMRNLPTPAAQ